MDTSSDLLVEVGTEELPPVALRQLSEAFAEGFGRRLAEQAIGFAEVECFATPRRLALLVKGIATRQPDLETLRRGPAVTAAFGSDGTPSRAAEGFARSCGVGVEDLGRERTERGEWLAFRARMPGRTTGELVPAIVAQALEDLPIPKRMRWGDGDAQFVRPIHWICLLLGSSPVRGRILGVEASVRTWGHRFHHPREIGLGNALEYAERLRTEGFVEPSFERRRELIRA
jgi:glycyl-tRNA synthetase beta chain